MIDQESDIGGLHSLLFLIALQNREARLMRESGLPGSRGDEIADSDAARERLRQLEKDMLGPAGESRPSRGMYK